MESLIPGLAGKGKLARLIQQRPLFNIVAVESNIFFLSRIDIDECRILNPCDDNADCLNTNGSYTCACRTGFTGNGSHCKGLDQPACMLVFLRVSKLLQPCKTIIIIFATLSLLLTIRFA